MTRPVVMNPTGRVKFSPWPLIPRSASKRKLARIIEQGNGAMRQRRAWRRRGEVADVIAELASATLFDTSRIQ